MAAATTCLAAGLDVHDCSEHPDTASVVPEVCTTWSYRMRHLSITMEPVNPGRAGRTLCADTEAFDQAAIDWWAIYDTGPSTRGKRLTDLPWCKKCLKKAEKAGVEMRDG